MIYKNTLYIVFFLLLFGCIELYDEPFEEKSNYLVVEGHLSSQPGPYMVRLSTTRNIRNETNAFKLRINNAFVSISREGGKTVRLNELDTTGIYYTSPEFRAEAGESYVLTIVLENGGTYESDPVSLPPLPQIDSIGITYGSQQFVSQQNSSLNRTGFYVDAFLNDPADQQNYYLINWNYTYKIKTQQDPAAGCCDICWVEDEAPGFDVFSDQVQNGDSETEFPLFFLPVVGKMLYEKIYLVAKVRSLDKQAYLFWKTVADARKRGGIFDPIPGTVRSNVRNIADNSELVLGYFYATSIDSVVRYVYPKDFPERTDYNTGYAASCTMLPNTTSVQPDYWE